MTLTSKLSTMATLFMKNLKQTFSRKVFILVLRMNVVNIPNSLPQVHGIMNLHGEVIAVYSLAEQFHYPEQKINNIIVASMNGTKIGLEVGNVDEIIDVPDEKVISMPVIMKAVENCFDEVASYAKELIVLIEVSKLMPEAEQQAIQKLVEQQS